MAISVSNHGAVRVVVIDRPERRNALDSETSAAFGRAVTEAAEDDDVRVLVLTGAGDRAFCSGMDLKAFRDLPPGAVGGGSVGGSGGFGPDAITEHVYPKPVIAAVNGAAVGGGLGLALACDLLVAAEHATFGLPEVQRGLVGTGAGARTVLRLPPAIAMELLLTGEPIDAAQALALGLVNRVVPAAELMETALALAERIAANGPLAVRLSKALAYEVRQFGPGLDMARLRELTAPAIRSDDAREGAAAFAEKRPPRFTGH
jgi:enoyl-CoA hydratase